MDYTNRASSSSCEALAYFFIGGSSSGRTADSDSVNLGSNLSPPVLFSYLFHTKLREIIMAQVIINGLV